MIIDSQKYNGKCSCGHEHTMTTEFCVIEAGGLENIDKYIEKFDVQKFMKRNPNMTSADFYMIMYNETEGLVR